MILKPIDNINLYSSKAVPVVGVFASLKWLSIYGNALTVIGIYKDEHQLIGGFYYLKTKKAGLSFIKLPPYTPHCGLFYISDSKTKASQNSFVKDIVAEVCNYFSAQNNALTVLAFPWFVKDLQPFVWEKYKVVPNYTYHISLQQTMDVIRSHYDSKNRNAINKALKEGVEVRQDSESKENLYRFFKNSLTSAKANVYDKELHGIFNTFADASNSFCMSAYKDGQLLGNVFCIYDDKTCYYLLGGVDKKSGIQGVNNLLVDKCIENAQRLGCHTFDFEGSMLKGVEKFFKGVLGPELVPYYTVNKAILPLEIALKFKKRELF